MDDKKLNIYDGIYYRMQQLGIYISKAPLYFAQLSALKLCIERMNHEYQLLRKHLHYQNILDGDQRCRWIDEAISRNANASNKYIIEGERICKKDDNGETYFRYNEKLKIQP